MPLDASILLQPRRAHLVGVAGNGMRSLAEVLLDAGWRVSGSDLDIAPVRSLAARGLRLLEGQRAENVPNDLDVLVYSDAAPPDNPERRQAAAQGTPAISYFEMLGRLGVGRRVAAVAGTHGKSTTTAMTARILLDAGLDPTIVCGATPLGANSGGHLGHGDLLLVEACEYRKNFLHLRPQQAAILGIESDHFDCYDSLDDIEAAFQQVAASLPSDGWLLARHDCPSTRRATRGVACRVETFGLSPDADWSARNLAEMRGVYSFDVWRRGRPFCRALLQTPGEHNVLNALAAAAIAHENGVSAERIAQGLAGFRGLHRRLERLGRWRGAVVIDDYAHHPTEITAALTAVRRMFPGTRIWCVLQPHQASRTRRLLDPLAASLRNADRVLVGEIFRAREGDPQPGETTAADLARRAKTLGVEVLPGHTAPEIVETLKAGLAPGDVLVTLGAGDVDKYREDDEIRMTNDEY